jgi:hypothetical protein
MSQTELPVDENKLSEVETAYKFRFPEQYKAFLLQSNGGKINPRNFSFGDEDYEGSRIDRFLAVYDGDHDNFETYFKIYKLDEQRIPENLVPIAHDDGGNLICISVEGEDSGAVYFWDHEYELEDEENVFLIKPDFNEFLASLT